MDRLNQLRSEAGSSKDLTFDTSSAPSEAYLTANESDSSKFFSLSEVDSTFIVSPTKESPATAADVVDTVAEPNISPNLSPIQKTNDLSSFKIGKQIEAANILSGGVNIFDDNSYDGDELVIDDNAGKDDKPAPNESEASEAFDKVDENLPDSLDVPEAIPSKDTEVVLQIDGKNVDAIDIGNDLYLYRQAGEEELAAVQIIEDDQQQPSFKFLKVRENAEGNLEVYEEIEIEVPKEMPEKKTRSSGVVVKKDIEAVNTTLIISEKIPDKMMLCPENDGAKQTNIDSSKEPPETKAEVNLNGKTMKFSESRKSPLISTFKPMTYHSTPNKEGIPLTKSMVNQQLHPSRHSDNVKKTIEVHTDNTKQKSLDTSCKVKDSKCQKSDLMETIENICTVGTENNTTVLCHRSENKIVNENNTENKEECNNKIEEDNVNVSLNEIVSDGSTQTLEKVQSKSENKGENVIKDCESIPHSLSIKMAVDCTPQTVNNSSKADENISVSPVSLIVDANHINDVAAQLAENSNTAVENSILSSLKTNDTCSAASNVDLKATSVTTLKEDHDIKKTESILPECKNEEKTEPVLNSTDIKIHDKSIQKSDQLETSDTDLNVGLCEEADSKMVNTIENILETNNLKVIDQTIIKTQPSTSQKNNDINDKEDEQKIVSETVSVMSPNINQLPLKPKKSDKCIPIPITTEKATSDGIVVVPKLFNNEEKNELKKSEIKKTDQKPMVSVKEISKLPKNNDMVFNQQHIKKVESKQTALFKNELDIKNKVDANLKIPSNKAAVPFGQWTEANRQEFLIKIKESKISSNTSSTNQLKQANDLNRRDVLKKIDSQRQTCNSSLTKVQDVKKSNNNTSKPASSAFTKTESQPKSTNHSLPKNSDKKNDSTHKSSNEATQINIENDWATLIKKSLRRNEIHNQDLIDNTIEGIINRALPSKVSTYDTKTKKEENIKDNATCLGSVTLDDIERKMNELHGIPFVERPAHELPLSSDTKTSDKSIESVSDENKKETFAPFVNKPQTSKNVEAHHLSDEEIIEHEPITGDMEPLAKEQSHEAPSQAKTIISKKDSVITETDFDKFARRNSVTYENCITVNFDKRETNVSQSIVVQDMPIKKMSRNELMLAESKAKSSNKQQNMRQTNQFSKIPTAIRHPHNETAVNKSYQTKVQIAYQSALTAKRQQEIPITIIEDKPVKVVFIDSRAEYPMDLNVQGQSLSPSKKPLAEAENSVNSASESLDSDILEDSLESKSQEEVKIKSKHQRKQVLTPVIESPELQLIEPIDLGIEISPKKKRKFEDKQDRIKPLVVPKKTYLLSRNVIEENLSKTQNITKNSQEEHVVRNDSYVVHDSISAFDNLVKAAELIETQSNENKDVLNNEKEVEISQVSPPKRGRGRPRKYPLNDSEEKIIKSPSPQKKIKIMHEKNVNSDTESELSSEEGIVKENWTMGKINEKIVCPICNKLFRSENVVFKHVKHCPGPSPNRSDSDKRSSRRLRNSGETRRLSIDSQSDDLDSENEASNNTNPSSENTEIIKEKVEKEKIVRQDSKEPKSDMEESKKTVKQANVNNHVCELCKRSFRQLSYLLSHKLQHQHDNKKSSNENTTKSIFCCEVCKKEFRKLHHLVQHRIIHSPSMTSRLTRKSSFENNESKMSKSQTVVKKSEDHSAGFRCEPCDKSFRKLHHLVEHRETHDGIYNKKCVTQNVSSDVGKQPQHQCEKCKKSFKKLQHLIEHKDQHLETSSEKSDDKSVKSSLSTKDIIHECSLCYMVFPNEHSLNKHAFACQRKKKQSSMKNAKQMHAKSLSTTGSDNDNEIIEIKECIKTDPDEINAVPNDQKELTHTVIELDGNLEISKPFKNEDVELQPINLKKENKAKEFIECEIVDSDSKSDDDLPLVCAKEVKSINKPSLETKLGTKHKLTDVSEIIIIPDTPTPKKKPPIKEKMGVTITKKMKLLNVQLPVVDDSSSGSNTSDDDDDDVRYMLNPEFKQNETVEEKFMKVRNQKRNSLQIERPISKDLVKRRISLQHPPKVPRLKAKAVETYQVNSATVTKSSKNHQKVKPSIDSDDSEIKYSFPKKTVEKTILKCSDKKKTVRKCLVDKRKSLSQHKNKLIGKQKIVTPIKNIRKRAEIEHRCDCGQLFSSAALLSRHTTLAHTPPRIRKRRSPPPEDKPKSTLQPKPTAQNVTTLNKSKNSAETRKSSVNNSDVKAGLNDSKTTRRSVAHKGVPVPEKMRKIMDRLRK